MLLLKDYAPKCCIMQCNVYQLSYFQHHVSFCTGFNLNLGPTQKTRKTAKISKTAKNSRMEHSKEWHLHLTRKISYADDVFNWRFSQLFVRMAQHEIGSLGMNFLTIFWRLCTLSKISLIFVSYIKVSAVYVFFNIHFRLIVIYALIRVNLIFFLLIWSQYLSLLVVIQYIKW